MSDPKTPKSKQTPLQTDARYLYATLQDGDLRQRPQLANTIRLALESSNPAWQSAVARLVRVQRITRRVEEPPPPETLFTEPNPNRIRGQIYSGRTLPSRHPAFLPIGEQSHSLVAGGSGTGKSSWLDFISLQFHILGTPFSCFDISDQRARILIPHMTPEQLRVCDLSSYRRNLFYLEGVAQKEWLRASQDHIAECLQLEPVTTYVLLDLCNEIIADGRIATLPGLIEKLRSPGHRSAPHKALLKRLLWLVNATGEAFTSERGFDKQKLFKASLVLNLGDAPEPIRRLIVADHQAAFTQLHKAMPRWQLRRVMIIHESSSLIGSGGPSSAWGESVFQRMVRQIRNYGVKFYFADQTPQKIDTVVRSNLQGSKILFRLGDDAAVDVFRHGLTLTPAQRTLLMQLPDRVALLHRPNMPPFLIRVPTLF